SSTFLKTVILTHRLVVKVFTVHDEKNLVHARHFGSKLSSLKRCQRLAGSCGVPDVATGFNSAQTLIVIRNLNALQDAFGSDNLVRAHHHQSLINGEYAV